MAVEKEFDVIVCGGGTAGSVAAIRAARLGLRTALVERQSQLGGTSTLGLVTPVMPNEACGRELVAGIHRELHDELTRQGFGDARGFDPVRAAFVLEEMAVQAGVTFFYHTELLGVQQHLDKLNHLELSACGKRFFLSASFYIDATGDALLALMCGQPVREGREGSGEHQPLSLRFILSGVDVQKAKDYIVRNTPAGTQYIWPCDETCASCTLSIHPEWLEARGGETNYLAPWKSQLMFSFYTIPGRPEEVCFNAPRVLCVNSLDSACLSQAYIDGRKQILGYERFFKEHVPGFENSYISYVAPLIGIRECRRIIGDFILTEQHVQQFARFEDAVCLCNYAIDIHHNQDGGATLWYLPQDKWYEIPYRAMVPKTIKNMIVAGRCISTDFVAHSSYRIIPICRGLGEASAWACRLAKTKSVDFHDVRGGELKQQLIDQGIMIEPQ
jgi:ribulose 1,5-bisphosphate synthetase/thiazole synthase